MARVGAVVLLVAASLALLGAARFGLGTRVDEPVPSG